MKRGILPWISRRTGAGGVSKCPHCVPALGNIIGAGRLPGRPGEQPPELRPLPRTLSHSGYQELIRPCLCLVQVSAVQGDYQISGFATNAADTVQNFRKNFITESDWAKLANVGINTVRIPIGWWIAQGANPDPPFIPGADAILDNAFVMAGQHPPPLAPSSCPSPSLPLRASLLLPHAPFLRPLPGIRSSMGLRTSVSIQVCSGAPEQRLPGVTRPRP